MAANLSFAAVFRCTNGSFYLYLLFSAGLDFLKIKNVKTAQVGRERIRPRSREDTMQVTNPAIARVLLRLTAPQIAGIAPMNAPPKSEPRSVLKIKGSIKSPPEDENIFSSL